MTLTKVFPFRRSIITEYWNALLIALSASPNSEARRIAMLVLLMTRDLKTNLWLDFLPISRRQYEI